MTRNTAVDKTGATRAGAPVHERVYQNLREQILFGELVPGQAVTIQGLADALDVGMTPVREAIRRLISDGALVFQGNRRVSVPVLSKADADQIKNLRKTIECELVRRACPSLLQADITRREQIDIALDEAIEAGDIGTYLKSNYAFHAQLYAAANADIMAEIVDRLWLRFGPSLRVVCGRFGTQNLPDRHKDILASLRQGDADAAATAIASDVAQGMDQIATVLDGQTDSIDS